jgi:hypothetical protein
MVSRYERSLVNDLDCPVLVHVIETCKREQCLLAVYTFWQNRDEAVWV